MLVQVAPDITDADKSDIAAIALRLGIDGLVVSNTTIQRPPKVAALPNGNEVFASHNCTSKIKWQNYLAYCAFGMVGHDGCPTGQGAQMVGGRCRLAG